MDEGELTMGYALTSADVNERVEARLKELRPSDDELWEQALRERDQAVEVADALTEAAGRLLGTDFGEHSNANDPWRNALDALSGVATRRNDRPHVVTICGSTKFKDEIHAANARMTLEGNIVISLGVFGHTDMPDVDWTTGGNDLKVMLDGLHREKIKLADSIYVVNPGGYVGESTRAEIQYAESLGLPVRYLVELEAAA
jgi:hypothetical protein